MKKLIFLFLLIPFFGEAQKLYFRADTSLFYKVGGNNELQIQNGTKDTLGFLYNYGSGRTRFEKPRAVTGGIKFGNDTVLVSGGADAKDFQRGLTDESDVVTLASYYKSAVTNNEQSGFTQSLTITQLADDIANFWPDGGSYFVVHDSLFKVGGWDGSTVTDSIWYSTNKGLSWAIYHVEWPYRVANVSTLKTRYAGDYNYVFGATSGTTDKTTVIRFQDFQNLETMTTAAEYGQRVTFAAAIDDDNRLYVWGGQTDRTDSTTTLNDMWRSLDYGATWTQIQTGVSFLGGSIYDQGTFRDGFIYCLNCGNKQGTPDNAYSNRNYKIAIEDVLDKTKWIPLPNTPASLANRLFLGTEPFKGNIWAASGLNSSSLNTNKLAWLDKDDLWHDFIDYTGIDSTDPGLLSNTHATDLFVYGNSLYRGGGNTCSDIYVIKDTNYLFNVSVRRALEVNRNAFISSNRSSGISMFARTATGYYGAPSQIIRIGPDDSPYYFQDFSTGHVWGTLTTGNSTAHVPVAQATGNHMFLSTDGKLTIGNSSSAAERLVVNSGGSFWGNNIAASLVWGQTSTLGVLTYSAGEPWVGAGSGVSVLKFFVNNGTPNMVLNGTGLHIGANSGAAEALQVTGNVRFSGALMPNNTAGTSGQVLTSAGAGSPPTWTDKADISKALTVESVGASESITMWRTDKAITITKVAYVLTGSSPSVTFDIHFDSDRSAGSPTELFGTDVTTTSTTGATNTSFADATIPAGSWIWLKTSAIGGTVATANFTLIYTQD